MIEGWELISQYPINSDNLTREDKQRLVTLTVGVGLDADGCILPPGSRSLDINHFNQAFFDGVIKKILFKLSKLFRGSITDVQYLNIELVVFTFSSRQTYSTEMSNATFNGNGIFQQKLGEIIVKLHQQLTDAIQKSSVRQVVSNICLKTYRDNFLMGDLLPGNSVGCTVRKIITSGQNEGGSRKVFNRNKFSLAYTWAQRIASHTGGGRGREFQEMILLDNVEGIINGIFNLFKKNPTLIPRTMEVSLAIYGHRDKPPYNAYWIKRLETFQGAGEVNTGYICESKVEIRVIF